MTEEAPGAAGRAAGRAIGELERARDVRFGIGQSILAGLFIGWGAVAIKAGLNEAISGETGYVLLMAAAVLAAWFGGLAGGITATVVAVVLNALVFVDPIGGAVADARVEQVNQILYLVVAAGTVVLVASRRAARDRLADALAEVATLADQVESRDARLEIMLAASGTGFWEWDVTTGALTWSEAIYQQHGLDPSVPAPDFETYLAMIHPDDRDAFANAIADAVDTAGSFAMDFRVVWSDGSVHWTHGAGRTFHDDSGRPVRMIGTGQDITERRRLEEERDQLLADERRAGEFREAFIDVISHELRTPITSIFGLTQIMTRPGRPDDPAARMALLDDIRAESERLYRLVEDLLILSRVERGRLILDTEPIAPRRSLERIVAREAVELPSLDITLDLEPDLPIVAGEHTYIEQIVRNLLGNAAKYTPAGTSVVVSARREDGNVAIRVTDDGPGIPNESVARIFELFYRDPTSARTVAGSGIGLFVCASLAEAMGGRMWFATPPGGGSEFGFTLRVLEGDESDERTPDDEPAMPAGDDAPTSARPTVPAPVHAATTRRRPAATVRETARGAGHEDATPVSQERSSTG